MNAGLSLEASTPLKVFHIGIEGYFRGPRGVDLLRWECSQQDGILAMAVLSRRCWSCLESMVNLGAPWSDCLFWAIDWDLPYAIFHIARQKPTSLTSFTNLGSNTTPLKKAIGTGLSVMKILLYFTQYNMVYKFKSHYGR